MSFLTTPTLSSSGKYVTLSGSTNILANGYFSNGLFYGGLSSTILDTETSLASAKDNGIFYLYISGGDIILANGLLVPVSIEYSDNIGHHFFVNGVKDSSYSSSIPVTAYNSWKYPQLAYTGYSPTDNTVNYFTVSAGVARRAKGVYSTGYFYDSGNTNDYVKNGELVTNYSQSIPQIAKDNGLYYTFLNGVPSLAEGIIDGNIYVLGVKQQTIPIPTLSGEKYVIDNSGSIFLANGLYSNGEFLNGDIVTGPSLSSYIGRALDDGKYYVVYAGLSTTNSSSSALQLATGIFDNYAFLDGQINYAYNYLTPRKVKTSASRVNQNYETLLRYVHLSGTGVLANGFYSIGNYVSGNLVTSVSLCAESVLDSDKFYDNLNGKTFLSDGYYGNNLFYKGGIRIYPEFDLISSLSGRNVYVTKTPHRHPDTKNYLYTLSVSAGVSSVPVIDSPAQGAYSNGFYVSGLKRGGDIFPIRTKDTNLFYSQKSGIWGLTTEFSILGFISAGVITQTPISAIRYPVDGKGLAYDYSSVLPKLANGIYNSVSARGVFKNGLSANSEELSNMGPISSGSGLVTIDPEKAKSGLPFLVPVGSSTLLSSIEDFQPYIAELSAMGCAPDLTTTRFLSAKLSGGKIDLLNDGIYSQGKKIIPQDLRFLYILGYSKSNRLIRFERGDIKSIPSYTNFSNNYSIGLYRDDKFMIVRQLNTPNIIINAGRIVRLAEIK